MDNKLYMINYGGSDSMGKHLRRSNDNKMIAGVCGGIGEYIGIDPVVIRLLWAVGTLISFGVGVIVYLLSWIIIPKEEEAPAPREVQRPEEEKDEKEEEQ
ncbi:PspC domain-containing protein [Methanolobus sp. ZRKC2]|uniref:PspC domain-containing protein n=1 Tax=Methanolobus sp. ZRKC2 TaxID=3125783 RepID=UPI003255E791